MLDRFADIARSTACSAAILIVGFGGIPPLGARAATAATTTTATGSPTGAGPTADEIFARARAIWNVRDDPPFVTCAILQRYRRGSRSWDNWWNANYRSRDTTFALRRIVDFDADRRRLRGVPLRLQTFGLRVFDTNADAEPIATIEPTYPMTATFDRPIRPATTPASATTDAPEPGGLKTVGRVRAITKEYRVEVAADDDDAEPRLFHLTLAPLRDPRTYRLRELWIDRETFAVRRAAISGIYDGEPYISTPFLDTFVEFAGHRYVKQIKSRRAMRFGLTSIDDFEIDYVDYHFPTTIPNDLFVTNALLEVEITHRRSSRGRGIESPNDGLEWDSLEDERDEDGREDGVDDLGPVCQIAR